MKTWSFALVLACGVAAAADWPRFRGPNGNGIVPDKLNLLDKPKQLWTASLGGGNSSLIVIDGRVYTLGNERGKGASLICLDADTGKPIWRHALDAWSSDSSPALTKGRGFVHCNQDKPIVHCFDPRDGKTIWRKELPGKSHGYGQAGSPVLWRDLVLVTAGCGAALKQDSGEVVWHHAGESGLATPILYEEKGAPAVLIFAGEALYARDPATGRELWNIPWKTELAVNACDPIYHDGKVFISTTYGKHAALFDVTAAPKQLWKDRGASFSSGFFWKDHLFHFSDGLFCCVDFATGASRWTGPRVGHGAAILADDKIILLSDNGQLTIAPVSADRFKPLLETRIHGGATWTPPSLVNGRLFVRNKEGEALCLQIAE